MENKRDRRSPYSEQENWERNQEGGYNRERDYNQQGNYENYNRGNDYNEERNYQNYGRDNDYNQRRNYEGYGNDYNQGQGSYNGGSYSDYTGSNRGSRRERGAGYGGSEYSSGSYNDYGSNYNRRYGNTSDNDRWRSDMGRDYGNRGYESSNRGNWGGRQENYRNQNRDWWDKTKDEVSSWFGDENAERRRNMDESRANNHKGKGPKNYQRSEERIREDVSDRLSDDPYTDASDIEVKVNGNEVILTGTVNSREAKRRAEDLAESVSGVKNVQNQLRIGQSGMSSSNSTGKSAATTEFQTNK